MASTPWWSVGATAATDFDEPGAATALAHVSTVDDLREVLGV